MKFGMGILDDMNHLKNKRIRSVADLLQDQFGLALVRLENMVRGTMSGAIRHKLILTPQNLVTSTALTATFESFFELHPLSQVLDRTNPLTQIVHGRKLSYLGPGGLTGRTASFWIRNIHPSHYGRICPIDMSEGTNVGLIGSLLIHARIGPWGSLESSQEEQVVAARYRKEFLTIEWEQVHLRNIFPFQYCFIGASLIPFIKHNDVNRALMSSNMQRQAVPLSRSEKCIVGTGLESQVALDSRVPAIVEHEGKIVYTDNDKIILSGNGDTLSIPLVRYQHSNKNTCMHQKPQVGRGKCIKNGQILADGAATVGGELSLGKKFISSLYAMAKESSYAPEDRLLRAILGILISTSKETCLKLPIGSRGQVIDTRYALFARWKPIDMVFNPLGVPSRMNVGQIFEWWLGLAGELLDRHYRIAPFDERYEQEASRKLVFSELYEASKQTANPWVFEPEYPGKSRIFDGRTGDPFEQPVIIGKPYILKLIPQVGDKIHGRYSGHYALVTQQPVRGRAKQGGQRIGEMEV
ncbi:hypothetical protein CsatB_018954 [Cannabis sativa]